MGPWLQKLWDTQGKMKTREKHESNSCRQRCWKRKEEGDGRSVRVWPMGEQAGGGWWTKQLHRKTEAVGLFDPLWLRLTSPGQAWLAVCICECACVCVWSSQSPWVIQQPTWTDGTQKPLLPASPVSKPTNTPPSLLPLRSPQRRTSQLLSGPLRASWAAKTAARCARCSSGPKHLVLLTLDSDSGAINLL